MATDEDKLVEIFAYYEQVPEFIGIKIESVHQTSAVDNTLLHMTAYSGNADWLRTLIEAGADVNAIGDLGNTPLHDACLGNHPSTIKELINHGAIPSIANEFGQTARDVASIGNKTMALQCLEDLRIK